MADEKMTIQRIIEVHAERSTDTVKDLKTEINDLKDALLNVDKASEDYDKGLKLLREDQQRLNEVNALTKKSVDALPGSYAALNAELVQARKNYKELTPEERANIEVGGAMLKRIQELDRELKSLDADMGQYQRNVGNYKSALEGVGDSLSHLPGGINQTVSGIKNMGTAMKLLSSNPIIAIIGIIAPILKGIASAIKENEGAMNAIRNAMKMLEPVGDAISKVLGFIGDKISDVVTWLGHLLSANSDTFGKMATVMTGVGNTILQAVLAPIKAVIAAVKGLGKIVGDIFRGDWDKIKDDAKTAGSEISDAFKKGFNVKENYAVGKAAGEQFVAGLKESKPKAKETAEQIADEVKKTWMGALEYERYILEQRKALAEEGSREQLEIEKQLRENQYQQEVERLNNTIENEEDRNEALRLAEEVKNADLLAMEEEFAAGRQAILDREAEAERKAAEQRAREEEARIKAEQQAWERLHKAKIATVQNAFSTMLSLYEAFGGEMAKESEGYKAIASAQAVVQALLSANEAYASMASIPYVGPALGAVAAAAALAQGMAQVRAINATNMKGTTSTPTSTVATPTASVSAPAVIQQVESTRTLTGVEEEQRMNNAQRVYLVYDDVQQAGKKVSVEQSESTF